MEAAGTVRVPGLARTALAAAAALLLAGAAHAAGPEVGFVAAVKGMAELRPADADSFALATVDRAVSEGDTLRTARHAWMKVLLQDDTLLAVDEETELVVDRFVAAAGGAEPSRLELLSGRVRTRVAETFGGAPRLELLTPTAAIGVKGTEWITWIHAASTWVCVVTGVVEAANREAAVAGSLDLAAGDCARIGPGEPPERVPQPDHFESVAMRPGLVPDQPGVPARLDPAPRPEQLVIEPSDRVGGRIDVPEPPAAGGRQDPTPPPSGNPPPPPPPVFAVP